MRTGCKVNVEEETAQLCDPPGRTYGIRLEFTDGTALVRHDVDTSKRAVEAFAVHFLHESIDEDQLWYLTQDFLAARYSEW